MLEALSDKLTGVFQKLGSHGTINEKDLDEAMREVRIALLEADVNFKVVRQFIATVREKALGAEVLKSLTGPQQVAFATAATELRPGALTTQPETLLRARRTDEHRQPDQCRDLWRTLNVVQENMPTGGLLARNERGQRRHTRAITSLTEDTKLNRALWRLAAELGDLIGTAKVAA